MSFTIKSINGLAPEEGKIYLFDANVWKFILVGSLKIGDYQKAYIDFFDAIIALASNPKCKKTPFIYVNGLIISEFYNAYMKARLDAYIADTGKQTDMKSYRATSDFAGSLMSIQSDIRAYRKYLILESDLVINPDEVLQEITAYSDYNDHYYFKIAQAKGLAIVSNDGDFKYAGVEIITANGKLIRLAK